MNEGLRAQHEDLISASVFISDSLNMFETTRRRVYAHMGYDYPIVTPGLATRSGGALWCTLTSTCVKCNGQHTEQPKSSYIMWWGYMPVKCEHGGVITKIFVEPEGRKEHEAHFDMPQRVVIVEPSE